MQYFRRQYYRMQYFRMQYFRMHYYRMHYYRMQNYRMQNYRMAARLQFHAANSRWMNFVILVDQRYASLFEQF